jgi:membrane protein DedA with SNARE-associated domain
VANFLSWFESVPEGLVYVLLGLGAALENVIPAVPADTFVALGGFLSAVGELDPRWIFVSTWSLNVGSALAMYRLGYTHGRPFFEAGWGRRVLRPHQMERMARFYARFGTAAIFLTRFLPGLRSIVPVFAGVSHQPLILVAIPIASASAIWYGALIWLGALAGQNLDVLRELLGRVNGVLLVVAVLIVVPSGVWWWRTRHPGEAPRRTGPRPEFDLDE